MFRDITIGQYIPGKSPLHRMFPALKIIFTVIYIVMLFLLDKWIAYAAMTLLTAAAVLISGINIKIILKGLRPMLWILVFTAAVNILMTPGDIIWTIPIWRFGINITRDGLLLGAAMTIRLLYLIVGTSLLTLTTSPLQLTDGIEKLLKPLRVIRVPSYEIAMMMTIAIRFIPTLAEETDKIIKAQTARGADFASGNILHRAKAVVPIIVPLFVSAFRRADELATAMEARCYIGGEGRTRMKESRLTKTDAAAVVIFTVLSAALLMVEYISAI